MSYDELGELIGHISIGLELVNALWQKAERRKRRSVEKVSRRHRKTCECIFCTSSALIMASRNLVRPLSPKTPEAMALHYIDNLDARLEMFAAGYTTAKPLAARIFDRVRPLPGNLVKSLEKFQQAASPHPPADKLL